MRSLCVDPPDRDVVDVDFERLSRTKTAAASTSAPPTSVTFSTSATSADGKRMELSCVPPITELPSFAANSSKVVSAFESHSSAEHLMIWHGRHHSQQPLSLTRTYSTYGIPERDYSPEWSMRRRILRMMLRSDDPFDMTAGPIPSTETIDALAESLDGSGQGRRFMRLVRCMRDFLLDAPCHSTTQRTQRTQTTQGKQRRAGNKTSDCASSKSDGECSCTCCEDEGDGDDTNADERDMQPGLVH